MFAPDSNRIELAQTTATAFEQVGDDPDKTIQSDQPFELAARYMINHADYLIAVLSPERDNPNSFPGGTAHTVQHWKAEKPKTKLFTIDPDSGAIVNQ